MPFTSILFPQEEPPVLSDQLPFFHDLNLDQIIAAAVQGKEEYDLSGFFAMPLMTTAEVQYRQAVMRDLEKQPVRGCLEGFAAEMRKSRQLEKAAADSYDLYSRSLLYFQAAVQYLTTVRELSAGLAGQQLDSAGLQGLVSFLQAYCQSAEWLRIDQEAAELRADFAAVSYTLRIMGNVIEVNTYQQEEDLDQIVKDFFARFAAAPAATAEPKPQRKEAGLNHVEAMIAEQLAQIYPECFERLQQFRVSNRSFRDAVVVRLDREEQFYLAWLQCMDEGRQRGLVFCYPEIAEPAAELSCEDGYDLAFQLRQKSVKVVGNAVSLQGAERTLIVTGPNQGGKTTFARMIGQLVYLSSLGLPVAARQVRVFLPDRIYTHFERQESEVSQNGKLQDDIIRIHDILQLLTDRSLLIINEMFASTTLVDAVALGRRVMQLIAAKDAFCIYVTFLEELASFDDRTVSMVSGIAADQTTRTYRLQRRLPDGRAYALSLAARYHLTAPEIMRRLGR